MNYDYEMQKILDDIDLDNKPNLFLHVCCAPCSSYVFERLYNYFNIFVVFYNPNIDKEEEMMRRYDELKRLIKIFGYDIKIIYDEYLRSDFLRAVKGYEDNEEGGYRCSLCFDLRLKKTYQVAEEYIKNNSMTNYKNYFCSTLSISPHKNAELLNKIGEKIAESGSIKYLPNDFKKNGGYLRSIEICKKYNIYRQNYCGCEFRRIL